MRRWHSEVAVMARRVRAYRSEWWFEPRFDVEGLGRARNDTLIGCRRAKCGLCHPSKRWHRKERRALDQREIAFEMEHA